MANKVEIRQINLAKRIEAWDSLHLNLLNSKEATIALLQEPYLKKAIKCLILRDIKQSMTVNLGQGLDLSF